MKPIYLALATTTLAVPAIAQDTREMDAHVHGVSTVEIAIEHGAIEINLLSPGMDIVGFEHEATSAEDKEAVAAAIHQFLIPKEIVALPDAAGCQLNAVLAHLHTGDHEHDDTDEHMEGDHDHDHDHDEAEGDAHEHEHEHGDEAEAKHSEFHVTYGFACEDEDALTSIAFPFFERFPNAGEIEVQYVTEAGAGTAELTPGAAEVSFE